MPLTKNIIQEIVSQTIREEVNPQLKEINQKIDNLTNIVTDFAGDYKNLKEDHDVLSGHVSDHSDRLEKLEVSVFGSSSM